MDLRCVALYAGALGGGVVLPVNDEPTLVEVSETEIVLQPL